MNKRATEKMRKQHLAAIEVAKNLNLYDYIALHLEGQLGRYYAAEDIGFDEEIYKLKLHLDHIIDTEK